MDWIRYHAEIRRGEKRGLRRAWRFVYLELSHEARARKGIVPLPRGMSTVDAVWEVIGGDRAEIEEALPKLEEHDMIAFTELDGKRVVVVVNWEKWNPIADKTAAERQRRHRAKEAELLRVTRDMGVTEDWDAPLAVTRDVAVTVTDVTSVTARDPLLSLSSSLCSSLREGVQGEIGARDLKQVQGESSARDLERVEHLSESVRPLAPEAFAPPSAPTPPVAPSGPRLSAPPPCPSLAVCRPPLRALAAVMTPIPEGFDPGDEGRAYAAQLGLVEVEGIVRKFRNVCAERNKQSADWNASFRTFCDYEVPIQRRTRDRARSHYGGGAESAAPSKPRYKPIPDLPKLPPTPLPDWVLAGGIIKAPGAPPILHEGAA